MTDAEGDRTFTREEADALIPQLAERLARIRDLRRIVLDNAERLRETMPANGGGERGTEYWEALSSLRREVQAVNQMGVLLRDADTGLVDFPAIMNGRAVFLCWRLGEPSVGHWHSTDTGFSGREPLE